MARTLQTLLRFSLKIAAIVIVFVALLVAVVFFYPTALVNPTVIARLEPAALKYGISWSYDDLTIESQRTSFLGRRLYVETKNFCVDTSSFDLCVQAFSGAIGWRWTYPLDLEEVGPVTAIAPRIEMTSQPTANPDEDGFDPISFADTLLTTLANMRIHDIDVRDGSIQILNPVENVTASTRFTANVTTEFDQIRSIEIVARESKGLPFKSMAANLSKLTDTDYSLRFQMSGEFSVNVSGKLQARNGGFDLGMRSKLSFSNTRLEGVHDIDYTDKTMTIDQAFDIAGLSKAVTSLRASNCSTTITNPFAQNTTMTIQGSCGIDVSRNSFVDEDVFLVTFPKSAHLELGYNATVDRSAGNEPTFAAKAHIDITPLKTRLYHFGGNIDFSARGLLSEWQKSDLKSRLQSTVTIERFQDVVASFDKSTWAIPAPFNVLDGEIQCEIAGDIESVDRTLYAPIACRSSLSGLRERVFITTKGTFELQELRNGYQPKIDLEIDLEDVALVLPPIDSVTSLPRIGPDSRIGMPNDEPSPKEKVLPIDFAIRVKNEKSIQLYSDLTASPIPLDIDMTVVRGKAPEATISSPGFELALIKQPVQVEYLKVRLSTPERPGDIEGRLSIAKVDTIINIDIFGTPEEPGYNIRSSPPMPQSELVAQMMYGSSMDSLDGGSQQSVSETRAAMADGAIGLVSMFYLASTPVESVGYNPHSGSFRAKVRLSNSLALNVGSDFEGQNRFGLTRRISNNWSLETYAADSEGGGKAVAMLRWANRY